MQYPVKLLSALSIVAATSWTGIAHSADAQKLAVVNVSLVFESYQKVADVQRRIDAKYDARRKDLDARGKVLIDQNRNIESQVQQGGRASEPLFDAMQAMRKQQFLYEKEVAELNQQIQVDYTKEMREVLSDIRQAIRSHADNNGYELVLRSPDTDDPDVVDDAKMPNPAEKKTYLQVTKPKSTYEVLDRFNRNPVLFGASTVDITADVLKTLNANFLRRSVLPNK